MTQVKLFIYNITLYVYKMCVCAQSYLTFCDPMDYSPPGSSGDFILGFPRQEYWSRVPFSTPGIFLMQGSNPHILHLLHQQADSLPLCHLGSPYKMLPQRKNWIKGK